MSLWCVHSETTDEFEGTVVCVRCGSVLQVPDLRRDLLRAMEVIRRDHGRFGHHSMRCVETEDGWCCADDCAMGQRCP